MPPDFGSTNSSPLYASPPPQSSTPTGSPLLQPRCGQHMREAAERRQQLELEHEQALAVLNAKQQEIDLLQKVRRLSLCERWRFGLFMFLWWFVPMSWVEELFVTHLDSNTCRPAKVKVTLNTIKKKQGSKKYSLPSTFSSLWQIWNSAILPHID